MIFVIHIWISVLIIQITTRISEKYSTDVLPDILSISKSMKKVSDIDIKIFNFDIDIFKIVLTDIDISTIDILYRFIEQD